VTASAPIAKTDPVRVAGEVVDKASVVAGLQLPASAVAPVATVSKNAASGGIANRNAGESAESAIEARANVTPAEAAGARSSATVVGDAPKAVAKAMAKTSGSSVAPAVAPKLALSDKPVADKPISDKPIADRPITEKSAVNSMADSRTELPSATVDAKQPEDSSLLQWRLGQTRQWLQRVAKNRYSIQLLATDAGQRSNLEAFLARRKRAGQIEKIFVYSTRIHSREWYGVLFGEFESYSQAREALRELPPELLRHKPFIRNVKDINALG
jgi:hypothetical protein